MTFYMSTKLRKQKIKCTKDELVAASQAGPLKCNNALQLSNLAKIKKKKKFKIKKIKKNVSAPPGLGRIRTEPTRKKNYGTEPHKRKDEIKKKKKKKNCNLNSRGAGLSTDSCSCPPRAGSEVNKTIKNILKKINPLALRPPAL
jgi:hypothetical protein